MKSFFIYLIMYLSPLPGLLYIWSEIGRNEKNSLLILVITLVYFPIWLVYLPILREDKRGYLEHILGLLISLPAFLYLGNYWFITNTTDKFYMLVSLIPLYGIWWYWAEVIFDKPLFSFLRIRSAP